MKKYQTEFKLEVVKSFLAGEGGAKLLARRGWIDPGQGGGYRPGQGLGCGHAQ